MLIGLAIQSLACAESREDSLRKACSIQKDSLRIDAHLQLGKYYLNSLGNIDSLMALSTRALAMCKATNHAQKYQAKKQIAFGYVMRLDTVKSLPALNDALGEARLLKDAKLEADMYHAFASYYGNKGMTDSSLAYLVREAETAEKAEYYNALAIAYSSIGWIYRGRQQFQLALSYHRKALRMVGKMERTNIGNIVQVYVTSSQGYLLAGQNDSNDVFMDSARVLADSAMALAIRDSRMAPQASALYVYTQRALYYKEYESAEAFAYKTLALRQSTDSRTLFLTHSAIAVCNSHLKNRGKALLYLDSAKQSSALTELYYRNHLAEASWIIFKNLGDYESALQAHEVFLKTKDSLDNAQRTRSINEIEQKFNKAENEREIQRLAAEQEITSLNNKLLTAGIAGAILLALLVFVFYRQRNLKNEQNKMIIEQRLNRARMDPHFLFNTFTALQGLALKEKDPVKVAGFLSDYSVIMRQTLESTFTELISIEDEVAYLEKYLALQQMRTGNKFDYTITVDDDIDPSELHVPGMIIQPFIENAIEHGFSTIENRGSVTVSIGKHSNDELLIRIIDNGSGITKNETAKEYPSRATQIVRDQLLLLNKKHRTKSAFFLNPNSGKPGTEVTIFLPLLK